MTQPQPGNAMNLSPLETVVVELVPQADGQDKLNIRATEIHHQPGQIWERIVDILQRALRVAILQTAAPQAEASRIVDPAGFRVPPGPERH